MRHRTITAAAASAVGGVVAGLLVGATLTGSDASTPTPEDSYACRLAANAASYYLEHPQYPKIRDMGLQAARDCAACKVTHVRDYAAFF